MVDFVGTVFLFNQSHKTVLANTPFTLYNKGTDKLKIHYDSDLHKEATVKSENFPMIVKDKCPTFQEQTNTVLDDRVAANRKKAREYS